MMKKLAVFEGYIDDFCVTEQDLVTYGFGKPPFFKSLIAMENDILHGYLVYYTVPFTYDLKPKIIMKELYVNENSRGKSVGSQLMNALKTAARIENASKIEWLVLPDNDNAKHFYRNLGAQQDTDWETWNLNL